MTDGAPPPAGLVDDLLRRALAEDLGLAGDLTSDAIFPPDHASTGTIVARQAGRVAGLGLSTGVFALLAAESKVALTVADGDDVAAAATLATVSGPTRALLAGERTCLNLLGRLCGIATATADMVHRVEGTGAAIVDTRKTTPGLRALEKYAVRCGGGANHRFGLDDAVLIKDNHIAAAGSVATAITRVRQRVGHLVTIEVEVDDLEQLAEALDAGVDAVLCDNMPLDLLRRAVEVVGGRVPVEASGGITPATVRAVAETGVDLISAGFLTHSVRQLDVAFDLAP
ncbi:MAG TPA: carboxylating nicotinate-nucleotide diphosphorylase [Acidimicrobiia bacterium]